MRTRLHLRNTREKKEQEKKSGGEARVRRGSARGGEGVRARGGGVRARGSACGGGSRERRNGGVGNEKRGERRGKRCVGTCASPCVNSVGLSAWGVG